MNKTYRIAIIDDEPLVREAITNLVKLYQLGFEVCGSFADIFNAVTFIKNEKPDIVLLDIELGNENGFELFKYIPNPNFKIIFITAHEDYAVKAFRFAALDYILKPIDPDVLTEALLKAKETVINQSLQLKVDSFVHNIENTKKRLVLKTTESLHVVPINDIMYCEADRNYTSFYLVDKTRIVVSHSIGEYEELLSEYHFFRIHQSYLLNLDYIKRFEKKDGGQAVLKDETQIPVSTRKKDQLINLLMRL